MSAAVDATRASKATLDKKRAAAAAERAKYSDQERKLLAMRGRRDVLRDQEEEAAAERLLDEDFAPPPDEARSAELAELEKAVPGGTATLAKQRLRVEAADAEAAACEPAFISGVLAIVGEVQGDALEEVREVLRQLAPACARLVAGDQIRATTIGDKFTIPPGAGVPISGAALARALRKALPEKLLPAEFAETLVFEAAHAISSGIIADIEGK